MTLRGFGFGLLAFLAWFADASAADFSGPLPQQRVADPLPADPRLYDVILELGGGAAMRPAYEGAKDFKFTPTGFVTLHYLWLPGLGEVRSSGRPDGFSFGPSFRYLPKRSSRDYSELTGLDDIDAAFELGGNLSYRFGIFRSWVAVRYGLGGHNGIAGETGIDVVLRPSAVTEIVFGPRASFASSEYMRTYFGVTTAEAAASGLPAYAPGGGFKGAGFEVGTRYEFTPQWAVLGRFAYEKLLGAAADSPIVQTGTSNQFTARLGLSYRFGIKLFK